jgi:23S rRNA (pseudouridine1915-N3)-methyltransferase
MHIKIIAIGKIRDNALASGMEEYIARINHDAKIEIIEFKDSDVESEGKRIIEHLAHETGYITALGEEGHQYSSKSFSDFLKCHPEIVFIIGGPSGLSGQVKKNAKEILSLSKMTFPHEMTRLILLEQIYRGISIVHNRKYHRG